jgi:integrase
MRLPNGYGSVYKLSGKRRNPYIVRKTIDWELDEKGEKVKQKYITIGYAPTLEKGLEMLTNYNQNPYDVNAAKLTFSDIYERWSEEKFPTVSESNVKGYKASYKCCEKLYDKVFADIKLTDLQYIVDTCGKNYPTLRKLKVLFDQLYSYAIKYEVCNKNYSEYVDIIKHKDKNPNKMDRLPFTKSEIEALWVQKNNCYVQVVLMLIYSGVRISELLELKRENVNIDEHYFNVVSSKTESGIRVVPIADKVYDFFKKWYDDGCTYLLHTKEGKRFTYRNYFDSYWKGAMELVNLNHKPHDTRHTCISMLTEKDVSPTNIKMIVGHRGAMSLTERVYTHIDIEVLLNAINKI